MKFKIYCHPFQKMAERHVETRIFAESVYKANKPRYNWLRKVHFTTGVEYK